MIIASFSEGFKYIHTAYMFSAFVLPLFDHITSLSGTYYSVFWLIRPNTDGTFLLFSAEQFRLTKYTLTGHFIRYTLLVAGLDPLLFSELP